MDVVADLFFLAGLVLAPAFGTVAAGYVLGWLQRFEPDAGERPLGFGQAVAAVPFAALTAAMVLAPVVVAVWAVVAEEEAVAYLATVGFALGALLLSALADAGDGALLGVRWPRLPGVLLSSAVGFLISLTSLLGSALARSLGVRIGDGWRVLVPIGVAVVVGGLAIVAYRRRTSTVDVEADVDTAAPAHTE